MRETFNNLDSMGKLVVGTGLAAMLAIGLSKPDKIEVISEPFTNCAKTNQSEMRVKLRHDRQSFDCYCIK